MHTKRIIGISLIVVGAVLLFFANYIADQVEEGKMKTARGQRQVNAVNSLFSASQYTKPIGKELTRPGQEKINEGNALIASYESLAGKLQVAGIICIILGAGMLIYYRKS